MFRKIQIFIQQIRSNKRLEPLVDTFLFMFITLAIHFLYNYWTIHFENRIFGVQVLTPQLFEGMTEMVFRHTDWLLDQLIANETSERTFTFMNQCSVRIVPSCSGIKQILQFALLMLLYPGPWKHKAWFIPIGMVIIHITNIIRLAGLGIVMANWPEHWQFSHDYPARIIFYVVIFFLWVIWNDKFYHNRQKPSRKPAETV